MASHKLLFSLALLVTVAKDTESLSCGQCEKEVCATSVPVDVYGKAIGPEQRHCEWVSTAKSHLLVQLFYGFTQIIHGSLHARTQKTHFSILYHF